MKRLFTILAAVLLTASVFAQSPEKMTYQAIVRDATQTLVTNQAVGMQISILQGSATGTVVYSETQTPTTNINGLLSIEIGSGVAFYTIDWANGPYFLKTETDPTGGTNYSITGTSQLLSVPYALYAKTADSISGTIVETDPIFGASVAAGITQTDTTYWNNKLDIEIDGDTTNELQFLNLVSDTIIFLVPGGGFVVLPDETDPIFGASIAAGITGADTAYWNNKLDIETDPIFGASVAAGITGTDTAYWNNKLDIETDPIFGASIAAGITAADTTNWNTAFGWGNHSAAGYFADGGEATGADRTLGNTDNFSLGLKTNNATRLHITNDGNVGVGIQSPSEKLSVSGVVESTTGGFKFPNGTVQTTAATGGGGTTYAVGDFAQGGIVFWLDETGQHGLVCAKTDQDGGSGVRWWAGTYGDTQAKGDGPYAGEANTAIIIAAQVAIGDDGNTYAARICNELQVTEGGKTYGDWYLPSKQELNLMYQNKSTIDATATANGVVAFVSAWYWSSSEYNDDTAWIQPFGNGTQGNGIKNDTYYVRAIRAF